MKRCCLTRPAEHIRRITRMVLVLSEAVLVFALGITDSTAFADEQAITRRQIEFFENKIRPLLIEHCFECHSVQSKKLQANLLLDSRKRLMQGGDSGPSIDLGNASESLLLSAVRYEDFSMPPKGKLPDSDIAVLEAWIAEGAPWPDEPEPQAADTKKAFDIEQRRSSHWVWQPIGNPIPPSVRNEAWPMIDADRFILSDLESHGLAPAVDVDRPVLLRRLYFDLIGLPPNADEVGDFLADRTPEAVEKVVDRLLQSPHFGERWARHWLDLVRYAESRGHEFDEDANNAFQYRDYVIRALNADVPYNQFVEEHIAGDLFAAPRLNPERGFNESILGTGFWFLGEWVHSPVDIRKDESDRFDNMLDVMSKTFLGLTLGCARCHDHKFDAISTADYYALSGFLQSSDYRQVRFETIEQEKNLAADLEKVDNDARQRILEVLKTWKVPLADQDSQSTRWTEPIQSKIVVDYSGQRQFAATQASKLDAGTKVEPFLQDGFIFGSRPREAFEPILNRSGEKTELSFVRRSAAVNDPFWNGLQSISETAVQKRNRLLDLPQSGRTLRTKTFELHSGDLWCRVHGEGKVVACVDSHRFIAGPLHNETIVAVKSGQSWVKLALARYVGHQLHLEFTPAEDKHLEVSVVLQDADESDKKAVEDREAAKVKSVDQYAERVRSFMKYSTELREQIESLIAAWLNNRRTLEDRKPTQSHLAPAMMDGTGEDDHVLIRGSSSNPGPIVGRRFLSALDTLAEVPVSEGSGRLELARRITDVKNPLTARVIVNRLWHHLMGRGIVPTTDDFGVLGQRPTHPALLDHLATRFVADGWSLKSMIRSLVLSRTYRMSSQNGPEVLATDPKNLLWHNRPPKRLEGEAIRDAILSVSDRLDETMYGEPIPIHLTKFMEGRGKPKDSGPLDGAGRRSIYIAVRRNFLSPFMLVFDTPNPFNSMGSRNVSNVPAQALALMNDPLVVDLASSWGQAALKAVSDDDRRRIEWMYLTGYGRKPNDVEIEMSLDFLKQSIDSKRTIKQSWGDLAHALINAKEFVFIP